jgi:hypothetical protein
MQGRGQVQYPKFMKSALVLYCTAQLPNQDVSGDDQIYLGTAQIQILGLVIQALDM